ncbi:MAG TPA: ATP-binding protein [Bdellovibrionota bacterium]|jgi:signal transduction histidine kinase|nr:ATP-binding protein [Bdellovibrionota bacterium]
MKFPSNLDRGSGSASGRSSPSLTPSPLNIPNGGMTGALFRSIDWEHHPLGPTRFWPEALKISLNILFSSKFPMFIFWGPENFQFYNDHYLPSFGNDKHPKAMGQRGADCWPESWNFVYPQIQDVMKTGVGCHHENVPLPFMRQGKLQDVYWTYSYSPIVNSDGCVGGVLVVGYETTPSILSEQNQREREAAERARKAAETIKIAVENERENLRELFKDSPEMFCMLSGPEHIFEFVNDAHIKALGFNATGLSVREAQPESLKAHEILDQVYQSGKAYTFHELRITVTDRGRYFSGTYAPRHSPDGDVSGILILAREVTDEVLARESLAIQKHALELTLDGAPLDTILSALVKTAEMQAGRYVRGSIYLVDETKNVLNCVAAPNLPPEYFSPGDPVEISPTSTTSGVAAYTQEPVLTTDTSKDPNWESIKDFYEKHEIRACWSTPIISSQGKTLGTFAYYFRRSREPTATEVQMVDVVTKTAALVIERKNSQKDLERARDLAEAASATKSSFLANMSHEIRTPLGAIMGFVDLMKQSKSLTPDIERFTNIISRNSQQLLRIIDDILDLSKVEAGKMTIEHEDFSLPHLLTDFSQLMAPRAEESSIGFSLTVSGEIPDFITSDPIRIRQILTNIVGNAIKFTEKGRVELNVAYREPYLEIKVIDTGRGISAEQVRHLFQPFAQADASTTRKFGGTGLGLVLTKRLASALGGDFWLEDSHVGKGSTFVAYLKVQVPKYAKYINKLSALNFDSENIPEESTELEGLKILLVEDSPDNQTLLNILLTKAGADVTIRHDGKRGLQEALTEVYDIILMDVQMPVMDGHEATSRLRAQGYPRPIIALTAHAMKEERERSLVSGFSDFITKPVDRNQLITTLLKHRP